jgi:RHS repeat-associated protein
MGLSALLLSITLGATSPAPPLAARDAAALPGISYALPSDAAPSTAARTPSFRAPRLAPYISGKYFGARYFSSPQGRFMSPDVPLLDQHVGDPQSWNLYAYGRNNPLRYKDPNGHWIETVWDAANVAMDVASLVSNVKEGNWGSAAVDAGGLILDAAATALPIVPGGAGMAIKAARAADKVVDAVQTADNVADAAKVAGNVADVAKVARGGESAAAKGGRAAHREFADKVTAKAADGWKSEPRIIGPDGKVLKPDAITPSGRPVELKPNTPSGRRAGATQLKKYEDATGKKGRVVYYDP